MNKITEVKFNHRDRVSSLAGPSPNEFYCPFIYFAQWYLQPIGRKTVIKCFFSLKDQLCTRIMTTCVWFKTLYSLTLPSSLEKKVKKSSVWNSSLTPRSGIKNLNYNLRYEDVSHPHPSSACGLTLPPTFDTILHSCRKKSWITKCPGVSPSKLAQEVCWVF